MEKCIKCGHDCHCDKETCPDCVNDVCGTCEHEERLNTGSADAES